MTNRHISLSFLRFSALGSILLVAAALSYAGAESRIKSDDVDRILSELDKTLSGREDFISGRQDRIDSLSLSLSQSKDSLNALMRLADENTAFNNDSALHYLKRGIDAAGQSPEALPFR